MKRHQVFTKKQGRKMVKKAKRKICGSGSDQGETPVSRKG